MNYIECINVDYKSTRKESFYGIFFSFKFIIIFCICVLIHRAKVEIPMSLLSSVAQLILSYMWPADLQLDVKGCRDVYASFDKYVEVERLEGDNKYHAEQFGLQVSFSILFLDQ